MTQTSRLFPLGMLALAWLCTANAWAGETLANKNELEQHLCAKDEESTTEAKPECVECKIQQSAAAANDPLSPIEAPLPKGLRAPKGAKEIQRDLEFFRFITAHAASFHLGEVQSSNTIGGIQSQIADAEKEKQYFYESMQAHSKNLKQAMAQQTAFDHALSGSLSEADAKAIHNYAQANGAYYDLQVKRYGEMLSHFKTANESSPNKYFEEKIKYLNDQIGDLKRALEPYNSLLQFKANQSVDASLKSTLLAKKQRLEQVVDIERSSVEGYQKQVDEQESAIQLLKQRLQELKSEDKDLSPEQKELRDLRGFQFTYIKKMNGVIHRANFKACGMTPGEVMALMLYSMNGYRSLNRALRDSSEKETYKPFTVELDAALGKLASYKGQVVRTTNLPKEILEQHQPGQVVTYSAFTSTSIERHLFGHMKFVIQSHSGHYIAPYSMAEPEHEVLFKEGTKFKVLSRSGSFQPEFVLEEVDP